MDEKEEDLKAFSEGLKESLFLLAEFHGVQQSCMFAGMILIKFVKEVAPNKESALFFQNLFDKCCDEEFSDM